MLDLLADAHKIRSRKNCYVYEIYPQSPIPQLTQIAHLDLNSARHPLVDLLPNRVVLYDHYKDRIIFRVWDYRLNHSTCFSADLADEEYDCKVQIIQIFSEHFLASNLLFR